MSPVDRLNGLSQYDRSAVLALKGGSLADMMELHSILKKENDPRFMTYPGPDTLPLFAQAQSSSKQAIDNIKLPPTKKNPPHGPSHDRNRVKFALLEHFSDNSTFLQDWRDVIANAAENDEEEFFIVLGEVLRARRSEAERVGRSKVPWRIAVCWVHHYLWLMSDAIATTYLERVVGVQVSEDAFTKARQRMNLVQHPDHPVTIKKDNGLIFPKGWTA